MKTASRNGPIFRPLISLAIIVGTLLTVVFFKLEVRRLGYEVLRKNRQEINLKNERRMLDLDFARMTQPGRIESVATRKMELKRPIHSRVVQMYVGLNETENNFHSTP